MARRHVEEEIQEEIQNENSPIEGEGENEEGENEEGENDSEADEESSATPRVVKMEDGSEINFGKRAMMLSGTMYREDGKGFEIVFHVFSGKQFRFKVELETPLEQFYLEVLSFGLAQKAKNSCTAAKSADDIEKILQIKLQEYANKDFATRASGETSITLTQEQMAFARWKNMDVDTIETIVNVRAYFAALSKEELQKLRKNPLIQFFKAQIQQEAAIASLSDEEKAELGL